MSSICSESLPYDPVMRWVAKAAVQNAISVLPQADKWNYVFQRRVTKGLPRSDHEFVAKLAHANRHLEALGRADPRLDVHSAHFYEFGAGWDLIVPLAYAALGVARQTLVDLRPNVRLELVNDALLRVGPLLRATGAQPGDLDTRPLESAADLRRFGITYLAPSDARATGLPEGSIDVVTSTETLEHIPPAEIEAILLESSRILRPGGLFCAAIDMQDHYSFFDPGVGPYEFLRFGDRRWRLINSSIHFQNRLRRSDYLAIVAKSPFEILFDEPLSPTEDDLRLLGRVSLAPRFRSYAPQDLATRSTLIVLRRP